MVRGRTTMSADWIDLDGDWQLSFGLQRMNAADCAGPEVPAGFRTIPASVPGNVELDLIQAGILPPDLDFADNIYLLREYESYQWWYSRTFEVSDTGGNPMLVLEGVDTLATIWLNGQRLGATANMLVLHRFALDGMLHEGVNTLVVAIDSAVLKGRSIPVDPGSYANENSWEALNVRKAPSCYGWDIMPRVVSAGLWKSVRIEYLPDIRLDDVYLATLEVDPEGRSAELLARWQIVDRAPGWANRQVRLRVSSPESGTVFHETTMAALGPVGEFREVIEGVDPWYPRGYGRPALYSVELAVVEAGEDVALWRQDFGFRTVLLRNSELVTPGGEGQFQFVVNGVDVFCKGSNWVPLDAFHSRDASRLDETLALLADLNCNMIRCWGGNVYEGQRFHDFCDREGIMVWQDFALACALYPQTEAFHAAIRQEAETIVPMLRNHPSLVLWAGNNEIDQFYARVNSAVDPNVDDVISRQVLPAVCRRLDPQRAYLPSSPYYSSKLWATGNVRAAAEDHLWGPRDDFKGWYYKTSNARFASEIGYHGCPARSSLERMIRPEQLWPWQGQEDWLTHAVRPQPESTRYNFRIPLMASQIEVLFGQAPTDLDDFVLASQISQAEALKFFVEMFRLEKGRRSGILWWNIKDGWPQISDAVVDYYGNRKLAYHVIRRLHSDVLLMIGEAENGRHAIVAVNETANDVRVDVKVSADGDLVLITKGRIIPANGRVVLEKIEQPSTFTAFEVEWEGDAQGSNHYFAGPRPFDLPSLESFYRHILGDGAVDAQIVSNATPLKGLRRDAV